MKEKDRVEYNGRRAVVVGPVEGQKSNDLPCVMVRWDDDGTVGPVAVSALVKTVRVDVAASGVPELREVERASAECRRAVDALNENWLKLLQEKDAEIERLRQPQPRPALTVDDLTWPLVQAFLTKQQAPPDSTKAPATP